MITFRYHIVTLVSVFLALAIGIALGGGPLKGEVDNSLVKELAEKKASESRLRGELRDARAGLQYTDRVLAEVGPAVINGTLKGDTVALLVLPGAQQANVSRVQDALRTGGAEIGGTYRVGAKVSDAAQRQLIEQLTTELTDGVAGVDLSSGGAYEHLGALVGRAIGTNRSAGTRVDRGATSILSGLATAELISADGEPTQRAGTVVIVTGDPDATNEESAEVYRRFAQGLATDTAAVVVTGPASSAQGTGVIRAIRDDVAAAKEVSTVDSVSNPAGGVVVALVIESTLAEGAGQYGAVEASDGAVPSFNASRGS